jgi:hypothetical protein
LISVIFEISVVFASAYAAKSNSPTSAIPTARSPSRRAVMARCVAFSGSRNGLPGASLLSLTRRIE